MHYYQFNIGDYAKHTRHLTMLEDLAYRRLIDQCYMTEQPLQEDVKKLSRLIGMPKNTEEVSQILEDFFFLGEGGYFQKRIADEIGKYHAKADSARVNGKKGGRPKKAKDNPKKSESEPKITQSVNSANPEESESKAKHKPLTIKQEPLNNKQVKESNTRAQLDWSNCSDLTREHIAVILANRKTKKATNSQRAINQIIKAINESLNQGYDIEQIINLIAEKGWSSYKHEWLINSGIGFNDQTSNKFDMSNALNNMAHAQTADEYSEFSLGDQLKEIKQIGGTQ